MIPTQEMTAYPTFGDNSSRVKPDDAKYAAGFQPGDVVPAEWFNWLLNRGSSATTKLNEGTLSIEQEINSVLAAGNQTPDATLTNQLVAAISYIINQVRLDEQQRPAVGVPTLWLGPKPTWALDFGNGATTKYLWSNYQKLNNQKFWDILDTLSGAGWMTARDSNGFYVPDLRGIVPIGYGGPNRKRTGETTSGGDMAEYKASANKSHVHDFTHYHNRGGMEITGWVSMTTNQGSKPSTGRMNGGGAFNEVTEAGYDGYTDDRNQNGYRYLTFAASRTWSGITSKGRNSANTADVTNTGSQGSTAKPPTIGCMWIVRFD